VRADTRVGQQLIIFLLVLMCLQLLSTHQLLIVKKHISEGNTLIANHFDL
jgi:hypothetical protein